MQLSCCENGARVCTSCIWEDYNSALRSFIRKRIANEHDVEDILQDIIIKVHQNLDNMSDYKKISSWLYKIAHNAIVDYYRIKGKGNTTIELTDDIEAVVDEDLSENAEVALCLSFLINMLPEPYKQAILLTEFERITQRELSSMLGLSLSGAKSRVQRARRMLKDIISSYCELEIDRRGNIIDHKCQNKC
ncbi:MAG: RNA polymerase sigma factor SigZ [Oscillospiraceae bacterium]|nr:RNA polymerase sigma factor SigZ [Oscillospiraceae bacterium]